MLPYVQKHHRRRSSAHGPVRNRRDLLATIKGAKLRSYTALIGGQSQGSQEGGVGAPTATVLSLWVTSTSLFSGVCIQSSCFLLKVTCGLWFPKQGSEVKSVCPFAFLTVPRVQLSPPPASKFRHLSVRLWFPPHWLPQPPESCLLLSLSLWIGTSPSTLTLGWFQSKAEINRCVYIIDLLLLHLWLGKYRN